MADNLSAPLEPLKERELEILRLMADGRSNQDIADQLFIAKSTVRWYNKQIYSKLGTSRRTEAVALARQMGLLDRDETPTPAATATANSHRLPFTMGPFIGRDAELRELQDLVLNPDIRLVSIIATGGMGKSRLSLEAGHALTPHFAHGAAFVDLTPVRSADNIATLTADALGLAAVNSADPQALLLNYCRGKELLLIFDNFEHVLAGAPLLSALVQAAPGLTIIVSSRERLNLRIETSYPLQPIADGAQRLFVEFASMMRPTIELDEGDDAAVRRIVAQIGGWPLGLMLAATWVDMMSLDEIADEIQHSLDFLSAEIGDLPARQRSIHAVIDPTWQRLSAHEQRAFMSASVFRGGFTRDAFQQVTGGTIRTLQTLVSRSLIGRGNGRRYDMHPLLRQYAREKLETTGGLQAAKANHLTTFVEIAHHHASRMYDGHYLESINALHDEQDNFRAALEWWMQGHATGDGVALVLALADFWLIRSAIREAYGYVQHALGRAPSADLYYWHASYIERLGDAAAAAESAQRAIDLATDQGDTHALSQATYRLAVTAFNAGQATTISDTLQRALDLAVTVDDVRLQALIHNSLGNMAEALGENQRGLWHHQQALDIYEAVGDLRGVSIVTNNIGLVYYTALGHPERGRELLTYSLGLKRQIGDRAGEARRLTTLGIWAMDAEEDEQARQHLTAARLIAEELGELARLVYAVVSEGTLYLSQLAFDAAAERFRHALALYPDDLQTRQECHCFLSIVHMLQGNLERAADAVHAAIDAHDPLPGSVQLRLLTVAHLWWESGHIADCVRIVAALVVHASDGRYVHRRQFVRTRLQRPLAYRVQQYLGDAAWQHALAAAAEVDLPQLDEEVCALWA